MKNGMGKMKYVGKTFIIILTYFVLLMLSRLIMFWAHMQQAASLEYSWEGKHGEFFFWAPYGFGLPVLFVRVCLLFLIFHGRDVDMVRWRQIGQISKKFWRELWIKAVVLTGSVFGVMWYGVGRLTTTIVNSPVSPWKIYYFLSGTAIFQRLPDARGSETAENLFLVGHIFEIHMSLMESDWIMMGVAFIVYEVLRICFDKTVPLKIPDEKTERLKTGVKD